MAISSSIRGSYFVDFAFLSDCHCIEIGLMEDDFPWKSMNTETLEREYSPSSCVSNYEDLVKSYTDESLKISKKLRFEKDLIYGISKNEILDLCLASVVNSPLVVFIHGGYWQLLSKDDCLFPAQEFNDLDISYCAIDYTLAPDAHISEMVDQCRRSIKWLYEHSNEYGYDRDKIFLIGSSAGAHLAAMTMLTDWSKYHLPSNIIKGSTLLSGVYDIRPIVKTYINEPLNLDMDSALELSPLFLVEPNDGEVIISWGENETSEFKRQSIEFEKKWKHAGNKSNLLEVKGNNHFDIVSNMMRKDCSLRRLMMQQILRNQ